MHDSSRGTFLLLRHPAFALHYTSLCLLVRQTQYKQFLSMSMGFFLADLVFSIYFYMFILFYLTSALVCKRFVLNKTDMLPRNVCMS